MAAISNALLSVCWVNHGSDVEELDVEGVVLDELAAGRDFVAHEKREERVGLGGVGDVHLEEAAVLGVHRRLEELFWIHFTETLVALDVEALAAVAADVGDDVERRDELDAGFSLLAGVFSDSVARLVGGGELVVPDRPRRWRGGAWPFRWTRKSRAT